MTFEYSPYILPLLGAAFVSAVVAIYAWLRRSSNGGLALFLMAVSIFIWTVGYSLEIAGTDLATKYLWGVIQYVGIAYCSYGWLIFSILYGGQTQVITRRFIILTVFVPSLTILFALTTRWHGLIWSEYHIDRLGEFSALGVSYGPWFWVHFAYSYIILLIGTILLARALWRRQGMYRGQIAAMLIAVLTPWIGNALYLTGNSPIPYLDLTPFAFTVTVAALAWATFGFHLMDITPLARDRVVDSMREGMIVLDVRGIIVDINNAAARMIGVPVASAIGRDAGDVFSPWAHLVDRFRNVMDARDQISVGEGEAKRSYEVRLSSLQDSQTQLVGRVIMLRAMDEDEPQPRFAVREPVSRLQDSEMTGEPRAATAGSKNVWNLIKNFFSPSVKLDIPVAVNVNPTWLRTLERVFTMMVRVLVSLGTIIVVLALPNETELFLYSLITSAILVILWILALWRNLPLHLRTTTFLLVIYILAFIEIYTYGYSLEGFTYLFAIVILGVLIEELRGGLFVLFISLVTMGIFGWLIVQGIHYPPGLSGTDAPQGGIQGLLVSLITFGAASLGLVVSINALMQSLNTSWQKETQALNLLQQERDLLEQRIEDRTHALTEARDKAEKISNDLRKYFRAIEQSGNTIVITDTNGNIEYANPRFETSTGYTIAEAAGKNPRVLKSGKQPTEYYSQLWKTISEGRIWTGEFLNKRKDGSLYWESATIAPVLDQNGQITNYVAIKEDITARRQAETQLQKLSQAVEQSGNTVMILDKNGMIEYVNPKFTEVTGYSSEEVLGKSPALLYGLDDMPDLTQDEAWKTINMGEIWRGEFQNRRKDGATFWESATIAPVYGRDGEVINFVEIKQDITEQKILQDQLQKQNDYLSILHQITLDLLNRRELSDLLQVIVDRSAVLLDASYSKLLLERDGDLVVEAFTGGLGNIKGERSPSKLSWQAFDSHQPVVLEDYCTWPDRRRDYDILSLHATAEIPVMAGERCLGVLALSRTKPNYTFTAEQIETGILFVRLVALVLDNANLYDSAMKEIAERKHAESLLQESEARFRQIVENASDIIFRTDVDGNFTYVNPAALKIVGYAGEQEALGKNCVDLAVPEFRHKIRRIYIHQRLRKIKSTYYEFPAMTTDGYTVWVGQNVQLIMEGEQVVGFQAVARNITQLKQAQEALALSRDQALDASRFKSQLLSRVSHELRTPLGGILGYAELLQYKAFGLLNENQQNAVDNIVESTHYLTGIVNDLLDESQIESKSLSLHNEHFNPAELVEKVMSPLALLADKKGLDLRIEISPDLPGELYGDVKRLQQILVNLVGNAIKFTKAGEVSVSLERPAPAHWSIEVRDTGAGIPAGERQNIFEPFRQINNSISRENRGSGLGLAITKQLVELMGGHISLESEVEKGSLFIVTLPIINAPGG